MKGALKAVYTVEAAWIMSFCLLITGFAICYAYDYTADAMAKVVREEDKIDVVKNFRLASIGDAVVDLIKDIGKNGKD